MITTNHFKNLCEFRRQQAACSKCTSFCRYIYFRITTESGKIKHSGLNRKLFQKMNISSKMFCAKEDLCIRSFEYFTQLHIQFEICAAIILVLHFCKTP